MIGQEPGFKRLAQWNLGWGHMVTTFVKATVAPAVFFGGVKAILCQLKKSSSFLHFLQTARLFVVTEFLLWLGRWGMDLSPPTASARRICQQRVPRSWIVGRCRGHRAPRRGRVLIRGLRRSLAD
jgi:hypothetical protein